MVPDKPSDTVTEVSNIKSGLSGTVKRIDKDGEEKAEYRSNAMHLKRNGTVRIIDLGVYSF